MQTSDKGIALIKEFEGCKLTAYQDSVGVWTIGYGWTQPVDGKPIRAGMTIKQETAERLLKTGLVSYESDVSRLVKVGMTQGQFDALVSFTYNLGARSLSTSTLLRKLNAGDYTGAAAEFMWELTTKELCGQGLLCVTDLAVLERWCVAYEFWRRAVKNIASDGLSIFGAMGGKIKNPELTAKKEQESEMSSTGSMLGLDPSSRQRLIGLAGQKKTSNPFLKMINSWPGAMAHYPSVMLVMW